MSEPAVHADALLEQAAAIAAKEWGASQAGVFRLPGENLNYQCDVGVLKLSVEADCDTALEEAVQEVLAQAGLPVPRSIPSRNGERIAVRLWFTAQEIPPCHVPSLACDHYCQFC